MRDGIKLFTAVYTPKDMSEKHPILMNRTPYSCAPYGADFSGRLTGSHWKYYCRENYIIAIAIIHGLIVQSLKSRIKPFNDLLIITHKIVG